MAGTVCGVDAADGPEEPAPQVTLTELQRRAGIMFSGNTGAVVVSGGGLATTAPTYELARDARNVIRGLPAALYDRTASMGRARIRSPGSNLA